ncbi:uncharacterized protein LOC135834391 [Planococcus citri]|uniref:uncharacterized protein LOC135834391 n=1 Tax=Planococcus citri TaxID=170843 RepID=UPI0031F7E3E9
MHSKSYLHFFILIGFLSISIHGFHIVNNSDTHSISGSIRSIALPKSMSTSLIESFIELNKQITFVQVHLETKTRDLETKTRDLEKRNIELSLKEKEAEKRVDEIKSVEQLLKQKEVYINKTAETLNKTDSQVKLREAEVKQKEDTINKKETEVKNNEELLKTREKQLNEKENELENGEVWNQIVRLKQKEENIEKTETEIKKRETILKRKEEIFRRIDNKTCSVSWVRASSGNKPANALVGGHVGTMTLYVGRANHNGSLIPGYVELGSVIRISDYGISYSYEGDKYEVATFDEKNICRIVWVKASHGSVPTNAIVGGYDSHGENLYIGRATYMDRLYPGKVQSSRHCLLTPYSELSHAEYEVAVVELFG